MKSLTMTFAALTIVAALNAFPASAQTYAGRDTKAWFDRGALHFGQQVGSLGSALTVSSRFAHKQLFFMIQGRFMWRGTEHATPSLESETHQDYSILAGVLLADERWAFHLAGGPCLAHGKELGEYLYSRSYKKEASWIVKIFTFGSVQTVTASDDYYAVNSYLEVGGIVNTGISLRLSKSFRIGFDVQALATRAHTDLAAGLTLGIGAL